MQNIFMYVTHTKGSIFVTRIIKGLGEKVGNLFHKTFLAIAQHPDIVFILFHKNRMDLGIDGKAGIYFLDVLS